MSNEAERDIADSNSPHTDSPDTTTSHAIILAGGFGARLWPASQPDFPKQFLDFGEGSLLSQTVSRAAACLDGYLLVVTAAAQLPAVRDDLRGHPASDRLRILGEPVARNTLPAIALGVRYLTGIIKADVSTLAVMPADHRIADTPRFREDLATAARAAQAGHLVTFGIRPSWPATGYGYIEAGDALDLPPGPSSVPGANAGTGQAAQAGTELDRGSKAGAAEQTPTAGDQPRPARPTAPASPVPARRVSAFREKPDAGTAQEYFAGGRHFWNAGMFVFRDDVFEAQLAAYAPEIAAGLPVAGNINLEDPVSLEQYAALPALSIDYGIMEYTDRAAMVEAGFDWTDIGSWDELAALELPPADDGGVFASVEASGNYVFSDLPVALCGVDDLIVVVKNGTVLVSRRGKSQLVREAARIAQIDSKSK